MAPGQSSTFLVFLKNFFVDSFSATTIGDGPTPPLRAILPFNSNSLFGGVDATQGFFKGEAIHSGLFQLSGLGRG